MFDILSLLFPLFFLIGAGATAIRTKWISDEGSAALTGFTYWLALPALLIRSIVESQMTGVLEAAGAYLCACLALFAAALLLFFAFMGRSLTRAALFGLNATYGNVIFLATPLVGAMFGPAGIASVLAIIALHSGFLLPLAAVLAELGNPRRGGARVVIINSALGLLRNPVIVAIVLGFVCKATSFPIPEAVLRLLRLLGGAASPLALFCLGASLPIQRVGRAVIAETCLATAMKLAVLPVVVGLVSWRLGIGGLPWKVAVITASMPTGANAFLLTRRATDSTQASATTVLLTTVLSVASLTFVLGTLR